MTTTTGDEPTRRTPPPWLIPALVGALIVLLVVLLVVVFAGDDDAAAPVATDAPAVTDVPVETDAAPATDAPATEVPTADAPTPTDAPAATETPATDAPAATEAPAGTEAPASTNPPPASGPLAADAGTLAPGQLSIALPDGVVTLDVAASCQVTPVIAFNIGSYLFDGGFPTGPILLEIQSDEGASPFIVVSALQGELESFNGQDFSAGSYWGASFEGDLSGPVNQVTLPALGGNANGSVNVSFDLEPLGGGCATGLLGSPWPFAPGETPEVIEANDFERLPDGSSTFGVLAACGPDGPLLLTEGQILSSFEFDGELLTTLQTSAQFGDPKLLSRPDDDPNEVLVDQQGGGGDVVYVTPVAEFGGPAQYLTWTQPPTGVTGGLPVVEC